MVKLIHTPLSLLEAPEVRALLIELENATGVTGGPDQLLLHYLQQCHHPHGPEKWYRIEKAQTLPAGRLQSRVGKSRGTALHQLCDEIASISGLSVEAVEDMTFHSFFNKHTPHPCKKTRSRSPDLRAGLRRMGF